MQGGHPFQRQGLVNAELRPVTVEQVENAGAPDQRRDEGEQREVGQALQRIVLLHHSFSEGMWRVGKDADGVVLDHRADILDRRQVLPPLAGRELPEDGEGPQRQQRPGRQGVQLHRFLEAEQCIAAVHFKAGDHHDDDQQRLRPVPEPFVTLVDVDAFAHFAFSLRRVAKRMPPCSRPPPMAPAIIRPPSRSTQPLVSRPGR